MKPQKQKKKKIRFWSNPTKRVIVLDDGKNQDLEKFGYVVPRGKKNDERPKKDTGES